MSNEGRTTQSKRVPLSRLSTANIEDTKSWEEAGMSLHLSFKEVQGKGPQRASLAGGGDRGANESQDWTSS